MGREEEREEWDGIAEWGKGSVPSEREVWELDRGGSCIRMWMN